MPAQQSQFVSVSSASYPNTLPPAVLLWQSQYLSRFTAVADSNNDFNGTCKTTQESIPLLLDDNLCASWFPDITVYCCGAVGGLLEQATEGITSSPNGSAENVTESQPDFEPVCETTNFSDMLDCYKVTSQDSCSSTDVAPWGICNPRLVDTSNSARQGNGSPKTTARLDLAVPLMLLLVCGMLY